MLAAYGGLLERISLRSAKLASSARHRLENKAFAGQKKGATLQMAPALVPFGPG
jgi:hypothetical protein